LGRNQPAENGYTATDVAELMVLRYCVLGYSWLSIEHPLEQALQKQIPLTLPGADKIKHLIFPRLFAKWKSYVRLCSLMSTTVNYSNMSLQLMSRLKEARFISLSFDAWTESCTANRYLGIVVELTFAGSVERSSYLLDFIPIVGSESGEKVQHYILHSLLFYGLATRSHSSGFTKSWKMGSAITPVPSNLLHLVTQPLSEAMNPFWNIIAGIIYAVKPTSVDVEKVFSLSGNLFSDKSTRLSKDRGSYRVIIRFNYNRLSSTWASSVCSWGLHPDNNQLANAVMQEINSSLGSEASKTPTKNLPNFVRTGARSGIVLPRSPPLPRLYSSLSTPLPTRNDRPVLSTSFSAANVIFELELVQKQQAVATQS
jgi:hypothetical protein